MEEVKDYFIFFYFFEGEFLVVVCSFVIVEDSFKVSFVGVFESVMGINFFNDLIEGIERVFKSVSLKRVRIYMEWMGLSG